MPWWGYILVYLTLVGMIAGVWTALGDDADDDLGFVTGMSFLFPVLLVLFIVAGIPHITTLMLKDRVRAKRKLKQQHEDEIAAIMEEEQL